MRRATGLTALLLLAGCGLFRAPQVPPQVSGQPPVVRYPAPVAEDRFIPWLGGGWAVR